MKPPAITNREQLREQCFGKIWTQELNDVFANIASYYDRGNFIASIGLMSYFLNSYMSIIELHPNEKTLDVCGGTNAVGIALLKREPTLHVHAMDRSAAMQEVGRQRAEALGLHIDSTIGDVHVLPFPDNHFDVVTLQYASRHLRIREVFTEIHRVLKPGGRFYHSDMLRPANPIVKTLYFAFLRFMLNVTAIICRSTSTARNCRKYFIDALNLFYSVEEMTAILQELKFGEVSSKTIMLGMLGFHRAVKPPHHTPDK